MTGRISELAYGKGHLDFELPDGVDTCLLDAVPTKAIPNFEDEVKKALRHPIKSPPLKEIVKPGETVAIVVSDITRLSYKTSGYLPVLLNELNEAGVQDEKITVVIATGEHRPQTAEEDRLIVGEEAYKRVRVINHDSHAKDLVQLGNSTRGTEIAINRTVYESDRVILTGGISYHMVAGFGGGRKSLCPGVCSFNGIQENHSLSVRNAGPTGINPHVGPGILEGNPVSDDMFEICEKVRPDFLVNVVVNERGEYVAVVAGDIKEAFKAGCKVVKESFSVPIKRRNDLVIASCGGYPKDIQLYQSVKGLDNAAYAVRDGGVIILCSECSDGAGSKDFMEWLRHQSISEMRTTLGVNFLMDGFVALRTASIMSTSRVILISSLADVIVTGVHMIPAENPEKALKIAQGFLKDIKTAAIMPHASLTFPILTNDNR